MFAAGFVLVFVSVFICRFYLSVMSPWRGRASCVWHCRLDPEACLNKQVHWLNAKAATATATATSSQPRKSINTSRLTPGSALPLAKVSKCAVTEAFGLSGTYSNHPSRCPLPHPPHQKPIDSISSAWPVAVVQRLWCCCCWGRSFPTNLHTVSKTMSTLPCK